jgi:hypothetical protein
MQLYQEPICDSSSSKTNSLNWSFSEFDAIRFAALRISSLLFRSLSRIDPADQCASAIERWQRLVGRLRRRVLTTGATPVSR